MKENMKIALVYDSIYPFIKGGGEKRFHEIAKRLAKNGHEVHLYGMKLWKGTNIIKQDNVYLHGICKAKNLYTEDGKRSIFQAIYFGFSSLRLIKEDFDIMDCCGFPYFSLFSCKLVSLFKRKKLFSTWYEVWGLKYWKTYIGKLGILGCFVEKLSILMPHYVISVSQSTALRIKSELGFNRKIFVVPGGIDFKKIQQVNASEEKFDIIYAGRLMDIKNIDILIKTVYRIKKQVPSVRCLILGEGPEKKALEKLTEKLKLEKNIKFIGFIENSEDVYALMKASKVFVLPSTREGFGMVVLEANACGIPVITTNYENNAAKDLIEEGKNGFVCQLNENEMSKRIINILKSSDDIVTKEACINLAQKYDWDKVVEKILEVYKNILK